MNTIASRKSLDETELLWRFKNKMPLLLKLCGILAEQTPRLLGDVRRGIDEGDGPRIARAAHTLKGSLSQMSAPIAAELAGELEQSGEAGVFSRSEILVNQLDQESAEVQRQLNELTKSIDV